MNDREQKAAAKEFANSWKDKGYEKGESQPFWLALLRNVFGIEKPEEFITFEEQVKLDHASFIDVLIPETHVMIEQKGSNKDLRKPIKQSDGTLLTPFQQAKRYSSELPYSQRPRWIVTCNFQTFLVYDMENPSGEPEEILLENLDREYYRLSFLVETDNTHIKREMEISIQAGDIVGVLYDAILKQYIDPSNEHSLKSLNMLCVRLVFCLYAEDAGIFGKKNMFHDYLASFQTKDMRRALIDLFKILDTKPEDRDPYDDSMLSEFPYVNGGLFADENIEIPQFTEEIRDVIVSKASDDFDWSEISPTIFGAVFESTLNPETRRAGGMHYTSIENIHKLIDPLFLDDLKQEFGEIKEVKVAKTRENKLHAFQEKLSKLKFLDPACGSGNFLTETYISLRRLENDILKELNQGQIVFGGFGVGNPIQVSISQFYGIEINDFAVTVAKTALWIAESQMMKETEDVVHMQLEFLPLKTNAFIVEGNALKLDWEEVVPKNELSYIMGNPPFVGAKYQSKEQHKELSDLNTGLKDIGLLDYVGGWYIKASRIMDNTRIQTAFVSTNSITQGGEPAILWKYIFDNHNTHIHFAYRTFVWGSEAKDKAQVHCVIIGFTNITLQKTKRIYTSNGHYIEAKNISPYIIDSPDILVEKRLKPICDVPKMIAGNKGVKCLPLILDRDEKEQLIAKEPMAEKYIKRMIGSAEFINNIERYCLWLVNCSPAELRKMPEVMKRVEATRQERLSSSDKQAQALADKPMLFRDTNNPDTAIIVPLVSSEKRRYIPMGYIDGGTIANNKVSMIPNGTLYEFGVLMSNVHNAWMRTVSMRMKSDYSYSLAIVYNNFPWCNPTSEQKEKIEQTAQGILDARNLFPDCSLADLYDAIAMTPQLRKAHQLNDKAVMEAYGFPIKNFTESDCVAELMKLYKSLSEKN